MNRFFLVILLFIFGSLSIFAQNTIQKDENWETFAPTDEIFSVETPIKLKSSQFPKDSPNHRYEGFFESTYFFIFSNELKESSQIMMALNFVNSFNATAQKGKIGDFDSEKYELADKEGFYHKVLILKNKTRICIFQTVSPTSDNPTVNRIFNSIKINETILSENETVSKPETVKENEPIITDIPNAKNNTASSGVGSGSGTESGNGNTNSSQTQANQSTKNITQGVKLTVKPAPRYTDLARFYNIQGQVQLRVTFLSNGTIGAVTPFTKLPFGLTTQAILAAKNLRFEPAMRNGVPYNVVKMVVYSFTIY